MGRVLPFPLVVPALLVLTGLPACAQEAGPPTPEKRAAAEAAPLFASHEVVPITLEADFRALRREDRNQESEERPAVLRWTDPDGSANVLDIQVRTRGNFRLASRNCDWPPLRLNVRKGAAAGTLFENQDKLKLVGVCKSKQSYWGQYVLLEYLAYRTFNLFTPLGFRVRLVRVTYVDSGGEEETFDAYGFLIEDDTQMAARNGGWKEDWPQGGPQLDPRLLEKHHAILVDVFQYLIGNTDWSGAAMHNMELVRFPDRVTSTVPYDFDFAGIVDARYANPDPQLSIKNVRERLFRGFCPIQVNRPAELYEAVYQLFRDKKEEVYALWSGQEGLEEDTIKDTREYLDEFYEVLADPRKIESRMMKDCRSLTFGR